MKKSGLLVHQARAARERGAHVAIRALEDRKCLKCSKCGWWQVVRIPRFTIKQAFRLCSGNGNEEIGFRRFMMEVAGQLKDEKRSFQRGQLDLWADSIASFEFGVSMENPLSILVGKARFGLCAPHQDKIYQERKVKGDLK